MKKIEIKIKKAMAEGSYRLVSLIIVYFVIQFVAACAFTTVFIIINNSLYREVLGA